MQKLNKNHLFLFGLFLAILPYCYLCFFANPSADDFGFSSFAIQNGFLNFIYSNYLYWNGRYISNLFLYLNPLTFGSFMGYKIVSFLMIILFIGINFIFIRQFFPGKTKTIQLIISLVLSLLFIHNMPIISEGIYWYTGSSIYLLGIIVALAYMALLIKTIRNKNRLIVVFSSIFLFFSCGFNEVVTLLIVFFLAILSYIFHKKNLPWKKVMLSQFVLSILFASIMIFSPGNEYRQAAYQNAHNFSFSFLYSMLQVGRFSFIWIASVPLITASILYFSLNEKLRKKSTLFQKSFYINRWGSLLMLFVIIFICVFPAYWATGLLGQHRTLNVAYFFFLIMWFINLTVWYNYYQTKSWFSFSKRTKTTFSVGMMIGLMFTGNGYNALFDAFSGSAKKYDAQLRERFETLKEATESDEPKRIIIPYLKEKPKILFTSDVGRDPNDWNNKAYNQYFKIKDKEIVLEENKQD